MMSEKHKKITSSVYRPDFKIYQYVKLEGVKGTNQKPQKERFVSPLFGTSVPDKIVIPETENILGDNTVRHDDFRVDKKVSDKEKIAKYGTIYPEFGVITNKTREVVLGGVIEEEEVFEEVYEEEVYVEEEVIMGSFVETKEREIYLEPEENDFEEVMEPTVGAFKSINLGNEQEEEEVYEPKVKKEVKPQPTRVVRTPKYVLPPPTLFKQNDLDTEQQPEWVLRHIEIINRTLTDFNIDGEVSGSTKGPTVTRYEIKLSPGVNVRRVESISDTLMMNLSSTSLRIEAPIPGKPFVGIEIPNDKPEVVPFGNVVNDPKFTKSKDKPLLIALGVDIDGDNVYADIASMPHGLIAGATNSGKSVSINTFLASLLLKNSPEDLKLILVDPKVVELSAYNDLPHLLTPVITEAKMAAKALDWVVAEMEKRYEILARNASRDIKTFNEKIASKRIEADKMPMIVVFIDELADLMAVASQDVELSIQRITQKARAAGIHLIVATQRPSTNVIKGTIKSNIPSRIAFRVASFTDSVTIIDSAGAETLLGKGDMLLKLADRTQRLQGAYITDEEIYDLIDFIKDQRGPNYEFEHEYLERKVYQSDNPKDDLFEDVAYFVVENNIASTNRITREFNIGFNRAQEIFVTLEEYGIISELAGTKARDVLVTLEELEEILSNEK